MAEVFVIRPEERLDGALGDRQSCVSERLEFAYLLILQIVTRAEC